LEVPLAEPLIGAVHAPRMDRASELATIAAFVDARRVTRVAAGYAGAVDCALPRAEERARLERLECSRH
jgi:hypothetical protein